MTDSVVVVVVFIVVVIFVVAAVAAPAVAKSYCLKMFKLLCYSRSYIHFQSANFLEEIAWFIIARGTEMVHKIFSLVAEDWHGISKVVFFF